MVTHRLPLAPELAADDLLSLMLHSGDVCNRVAYEHGLKPEYMPGAHRLRLFMVILDLRRTLPDGTLPDTLVLEKGAGVFNIDYLAERADSGIEKGGRLDHLLLGNLETNVQIVVRSGRANLLKRKLSDMIGKLTPENYEALAYTLFDTLTSATDTQALANTHAHENGKAFEVLMQSPSQKGFKWGLHWLDSVLGASATAHRTWYIGGAYKQRKTTLALNMLLGLLLSNPLAKVAFYSREMPRNSIIAQLVAMLAVADIISQGNLYRPVDGAYMSAISGDKLLTARNAYKQWPAAGSVDAAIRTYQSFGQRLAIYDSSPQNGGLYDMASAYRLFKRSVSLEDAHVHMFDYAGLFDAPGANIYEQSQYRALMFQRMAQEHEATVVVLAQRNEESIKSKSTYSPGIKGGGDAPASADHMLLTHYKMKDMRENELRVVMKLNKYGATGFEEYEIHPESGLILNASWIKQPELLSLNGSKHHE